MRRNIARLVAAISGAAKFSIPYSVDFATQSTMPNWFQGGSWSVAGGVAVVNPTFTPLTTNYDFTSWSGGAPVDWTFSGAGTVDETPAGHAHVTGAKTVDDATTVSGNRPWFKIEALCTQHGGGSVAFYHAYNSGWDCDITGTGIFYRVDPGITTGSQRLQINSDTCPEFTLDYLGYFAISNHYALLPAVSPNVNAKVVVNRDMSVINQDFSGVIVRADSQTNPQNYICAMQRRVSIASNFVVFKVVNGTYTALHSNTAANATIELRCNGTSVEVWNASTRYTTLTIDEPTINNNGIHGFVSTHGGNSVNSFFLSDAPVSKTVFIGGSNTEGDPYTQCWPNYIRPTINELCSFAYLNMGYGGTTSWYALVRLQTLIDFAPKVVFLEFVINDTSNESGGSRTDSWKPTAEALIRKIRTALPDTRIVVVNLYQDRTPAFSTATYDRWNTLAAKYDCDLFDAHLYLRTVLGTETPTNEQLDPYCDGVHWTRPLGHQTIAAGMDSSLSDWYPADAKGSGWSGDLDDYAPPVYDDITDWESTPINRAGTDNDGETGTGWSSDGTVRQSSTPGDTISWTGTFCSFGILNPYPWTSFVVSWSIDGGAETNVTCGSPGVTQVSNFARGEHTVTLKIVSGTAKISAFVAI